MENRDKCAVESPQDRMVSWSSIRTALPSRIWATREATTSDTGNGWFSSNRLNHISHCGGVQDNWKISGQSRVWNLFGWINIIQGKTMNGKKAKKFQSGIYRSNRLYAQLTRGRGLRNNLRLPARELRMIFFFLGTKSRRKVIYQSLQYTHQLPWITVGLISISRSPSPTFLGVPTTT